MRRIRQHIRSNVVGYIAIFMFAIGGTAYATHPGGANTISSGDIINDNVNSADVRDDTLANGGLQAVDLRPGSVGSSEIADGAVNDAKLDSDSKARWAVVNSTGGLNRSKGVIASEQLATGVSEVTFNRDVSVCAWSATVSRQAPGEPISGEIAVRPPADNPNGVVVHTWDSAGTPVGNRFHLVVTC